MPEVPKAEDFHVNKLREESNKKKESGSPFGLSRAERLKILADYDKYVGSGKDCVVVNSENGQEELVVAYDYQAGSEQDPIETKKIFYLHRIFAILFPHNFPHFKASFSATETRTSSTVRQKINDQKNGAIIHPFERVKEFLEETGFPVWHDRLAINTLIGADGGEYYVDKLKLQHLITPEIQEKVFQYMRKHGYSQADADRISIALERLKSLS